MNAPFTSPFLQTSPTVRTLWPEVLLGGVPVARLGYDETLRRLVQWSLGSRFRRVATANLDFLALASRNSELRRALRTADLVTADGQPLVWLSRMQGQPIAERVTGADLVLPLVQGVTQRGRSVFLLGGSPRVNPLVEDRLRSAAPNLRVAGSYSGTVDLADTEHVAHIVALIRRSGAEVLLVALGCPKQDLFLSRHGARTGARLGIGIGATFEFLAQTKSRAPAWVQRIGLEWLFRTLQEPGRLARRYASDAIYLAHLVRTNLRPAILKLFSRPKP